MKKLKRVWGKIKLLETSAVGIPVYPYAHKSYSLVKALRETEELVSDELNLEKSPMEEGEKPEESEDKPEESEEETPESEVSEPEKPEKAEESEEEEKSDSEEPEVDKGLSKKDMMDMMTKGFQAAITLRKR